MVGPVTQGRLLMSVSIKTLHEILEIAFFTPAGRTGWGFPVVLGGPGGTAKSAILADFGRRMVGSGRLYTLNCGEQGEGAAGCIPAVDQDLGVITFPRPEWCIKFADGAPGVVIVDELTQSDGELRKALLAVTLDKSIAGGFMGQGVRFFAACNPEGQGGADTRDLAPVQANRVCQITWEADMSGWRAYMRTRDIFADMNSDEPAPVDVVTIEARIRAGWGDAYQWAVGLVSDGYLRAHAETFQRPNSDESSAAWPSGRSWDTAIRALATARILGSSRDAQELCVIGLVGEAAGVGLFAYMRTLDLPDPAAVLDGSVKFTHDAMRPDRTHVVLGSVCRLAVSEPSKVRTARAWTILAELQASAGSDVTLLGAETLLGAKLADSKSPDYQRVVKVLGSALRNAGVV